MMKGVNDSKSLLNTYHFIVNVGYMVKNVIQKKYWIMIVDFVNVQKLM